MVPAANRRTLSLGGGPPAPAPAPCDPGGATSCAAVIVRAPGNTVSTSSDRSGVLLELARLRSCGQMRGIEGRDTACAGLAVILRVICAATQAIRC